jgi:deoxyribodipyrimidine photo-lyase
MGNRPTLAIFWFRRDLRLEDNHALYIALSEQQAVLPIFIFDRNILDPLRDQKDKRVNFIHQTLVALQEQLRELGSDLWTYYGTPEEAFQKLQKQYDITTVYTNRDYEPSAIKRDNAIADQLEEQGIEFKHFKDQVIFEKRDLLTTQDEPYTVYTPYRKKWLSELQEDMLAAYDCAANFDALYQTDPWEPVIPLEEMGFREADCDFPPPSFKAEQLEDYGDMRDYPAEDQTSRLGIHLRFGTLSIRELARQGRETSDTWYHQLIWRDFYFQILFNYPHVVDEPFREKYKNIEWRNDKAEFERWCKGETGFPIVDAGMRQLNQTGYMHNRVRMIVASFLVKDLLIDWRWGERYFAEKLLDFDLAANNGNWQWAAGTGVDAAPYFRVFNPWSQAQKFDPDNKYVKSWAPDYLSSDYPSPMVDHSFARKRVLEVYKRAIDGKSEDQTKEDPPSLFDD